MYNINRGPIAETSRGCKFHKILSRFAIQVYADEGEPPAGEDKGTPPVVNYEQLIAQARKEEKDKLYPRLKKAEDENRELTTKLNTSLLKIAALQEELEKKNSAGDSEEVTNLKKQVTDLQAEIKTLKENAVDEESVRKKVAAEYEVKIYAQQQIEANKGSILSILHEEIKGNTKEEVDAAIQKAKEKTISIKKDLGLPIDDDDSDKSDKSGKKKSSGGKSTGRAATPPVAVPSTETEEEDFDPNYIRNLDPRSEEYKEFRKKMGLR